MRLLAIIEASTVTGPAKNLIDFCRMARVMGIPLEPLIVTFRRGREGSSDFEDQVRSAQIEIHSVSERRSFDPAIISQIRGIAEEWKPDILQTHAVKSHFLAALAQRGESYPWIAFHHGYTYTDLKMRAYNQLDRWSLRRAKALVTVSEAFKRQLIGQGVAPERITVLQNAVDPGWVERVRRADGAAARREFGLEGCQVILAVGRMSLEKAHSDLIAAFHILRNRLPLARLVLVGDGPERPRLEQSAGEGVVFTGQQRDVSRFFAIADVMALPSLTEGSPNVLLEAMACGVPSVATAVGGVPEIVTDGQEALLVPARTPEALAAAIGRVLTEPELRASLTGRSLEAIRLRHTPEIRARALIQIYEGALK
jgi:glycosyltransferase involved in cell wall biosynthesis